MQALISLLIGWPIFAVGVHLLLAQSTINKQHIQIFCTLLWFVIVITVFLNYQYTVVITVGDWPAPFGISLVFDSLAIFMLFIFAIVIFCICLFSLQDQDIQPFQTAFYSGFWLLTLGVVGAICTHDIFNLYVWSEVMLLSAFLLISCSQRNNTTHLLQYALFNVIGTLFMLLAIALLYGLSGSLNYTHLSNFFQHSQATSSIPILFLLLFGLGIKGALFPFYFWLPNSYPATSCSSTLLLSSLITKVILLVILRWVWLWSPLQSSFMTTLFVFIACCTMFFGVMGAATQFKLRDILSFHVISQIGYILLAIFLPGTTAIIAALYFLIHNVLVKTNLLVVAGIIEQHYQSGNLHQLGQIIMAHRGLAIIFFISAISLAGFPPFSGFWSKLLVIKVALEHHFYLSATIAIVVSLFTLYSMIKIWRLGFCQASDRNPCTPTPFKLTSLQWLSLLPLLLIPIIIGIYPNSILPMLSRIADELTQSQYSLHSSLGDI